MIDEKKIPPNEHESNLIPELIWQRFYRKAGNNGPFMFDDKSMVEAQLDNIIETTPVLVSKGIVRNSFVEKSITLFSTSIVASSTMPFVRFNYDNKWNAPALYLLAVFPASAGKGAASLSKVLLSKINDHILTEYNQLLVFYKEAIREYRKNPNGIPPERPKLKLVLAPGNTSSAKLIEMLADIDGSETLTLFETEIDVVGVSASGEFGNMNSSIFRQAFHHESISKMIKKDGEVQIANNPKLSIVLTGTANQVGKLLHSNADGLFSRFLVLLGDSELLWKNTQPCSDCPVQDDVFNALADEYFEAWTYFKTKQIEIKFTQVQWDAIQAFGKYYLMNAYHFSGESAVSIPKRHALMICRLATIFTAFRHYEQKSESAEIYCSDVDFGNALWMIEFSLYCGLKLFKSLPGEANESKVVDTKSKFIQMLPDEFSSDDLKEYYSSLALSERTVSRWIKQFVEAGFLERVKPGHFKKTGMAAVAMASTEN